MRSSFEILELLLQDYEYQLIDYLPRPPLPRKKHTISHGGKLFRITINRTIYHRIDLDSKNDFKIIIIKFEKRYNIVRGHYVDRLGPVNGMTLNLSNPEEYGILVRMFEVQNDEVHKTI